MQSKHSRMDREVKHDLLVILRKAGWVEAGRSPVIGVGLKEGRELHHKSAQLAVD